MTPQQLKASLLQEAIRGKLTDQRPEDGSAEDLYRAILAEKKRLIKAGKLKKEKPLPPIEEKDIPFDIPENWKWVRLGEVISLQSGQDLTPSEYNDSKRGIPYITGASNFEKGKIIINRWTEYAKSFAYLGELLLTCKGTVGEIAILKEEKAHIARQLMAIHSLGVSCSYLRCFLDMSVPQLKKKSQGVIPGISREHVLSAILPLPPLAEQERIVAKLEELLPLVERYGKAYTQLTALEQRFPASMRKSLLQEAIQGKLTDQRPEDGSAEDLYRAILAEKKRLIKAGKLKKEKPLPPIEEKDIPFDIPGNWKWVRLGEITLIERGGSPRPIKSYLTNSSDGINWIKIGDSDKNGKYIYSTAEKIKPEAVSKSRRVNKGDLLLTNSMSYGRPYILKTDGCIHDGWLVVSQHLTVFVQDFLYYLLLSGCARTQFAQKAQGAVVKNLNIEKVSAAILPLPPLAEQERIVAKLEELLPLCD